MCFQKSTAPIDWTVANRACAKIAVVLVISNANKTAGGNYLVQEEINIDLDLVRERAMKSVRRASIFMGIGVNASLDPEFNKYQLTGITKVQVVPNGASTGQIEHFKSEFRLWVEGGALRELVEGFGVFLDELHSIGRTVEYVVSGKEFGRDGQAKFEREGAPNKLNILMQNFGVGPNNPNFLKSIGRARNCLTHRRGRVGQEDVDQDNQLRVSWVGIDLIATTPNGEKHDLAELPEGGLLLPEGADVSVVYCERNRSFALGEAVQLSTRDLAEVCWFHSGEINNCLSSVVSFLRKQGVKVQQKDNKANVGFDFED